MRMFRILSEKELVESFRPIDRAEVELPQDLKFPAFVGDYLAWTEPSGYRTFILFSPGDKRPPMGIVFRKAPGSPAPAAQMCSWCHSVRAGSAIGVLTAAASTNRTVGLTLCQDLGCKEKIQADPSANDFPKLASPFELQRRMMARVREFALSQLF